MRAIEQAREAESARGRAGQVIYGLLAKVGAGNVPFLVNEVGKKGDDDNDS